MAFKFNIGTKTGKTFKLESEAPELIGKAIKEKINGIDISSDLNGYEFEITGASDKAGFTSSENVEGIALKKVLLTYGKGLHKRPKKEGKKKRSNFTPRGLRMRKTMRGKIISPEISQINLKILKQGHKNLEEIFKEQIKTEAVEEKTAE